jgi:hypothetical protein
MLATTLKKMVAQLRSIVILFVMPRKVLEAKNKKCVH